MCIAWQGILRNRGCSTACGIPVSSAPLLSTLRCLNNPRRGIVDVVPGARGWDRRWTALFPEPHDSKQVGDAIRHGFPKLRSVLRAWPKGAGGRRAARQRGVQRSDVRHSVLTITRRRWRRDSADFGRSHAQQLGGPRFANSPSSESAATHKPLASAPRSQHRALWPAAFSSCSARGAAAGGRGRSRQARMREHHGGRRNAGQNGQRGSIAVARTSSACHVTPPSPSPSYGVRRRREPLGHREAPGGRPGRTEGR
eukprot:256096-Chlamydomonas_euryale.AAC.10